MGRDNLGELARRTPREESREGEGRGWFWGFAISQTLTGDSLAILLRCSGESEQPAYCACLVIFPSPPTRTRDERKTCTQRVSGHLSNLELGKDQRAWSEPNAKRKWNEPDKGTNRASTVEIAETQKQVCDCNTCVPCTTPSSPQAETVQEAPPSIFRVAE